MKFETLYPNFLDLPEPERFSFFAAYRVQRSLDLVENTVAKVTVQKERTKGKKDKKITVSREQLLLLQKLGLA